VVFNGSETGLTGSGTLTNVDNTIRGVGQIQVETINQDTVRAEGGILLISDGVLLDNSCWTTAPVLSRLLWMDYSTSGRVPWIAVT